MSAVRLGVLGLVLAAAAAAALALVASHRAEPATALRAEPVAIERALTPASTLFGDPVEAEIDVYADGNRVPAGSVRVEASFGPYRIVARDVERSTRGRVSLLRSRYTLRCLTRACLPPQGKARAFRFPAAAVTYVRDGRPLAAPVPWPTLQVSSRVPAGTAVPTGLVDAPPAIDTGFARSPLATQALLLVAAALLAAVGLVLVVTSLWPAGALSRRRRGLSPLEESLALVEEASRSEDEGERRRTLDALATRLADIPAPPLETQARALAWGASPPSPEALTRLTREVRTALNGSVTR